MELDRLTTGDRVLVTSAVTYLVSVFQGACLGAFSNAQAGDDAGTHGSTPHPF